jgi:hypothetical protein
MKNEIIGKLQELLSGYFTAAGVSKILEEFTRPDRDFQSSKAPHRLMETGIGRV